MLKHGILGLLNYSDMTGYEIREVFRDSLHYFWSAHTSQIYRELQGLEKKDWVSKVYIPQQGKPDKNIYSITKEGRAELIRWLAEDNVELSPRSPVLMKTFFMGERSREENICFFKDLKACYEMYLKGLEVIPEYIKFYGDAIGAGDKALYWEMTVDYGIRNLQMNIEWAQRCIERLEEAVISSPVVCSGDADRMKLECFQGADFPGV